MIDAENNLMQQASRALRRMDYLTCEACCLDALEAARDAGDWSEYARILLPLQECRRQRRIISATGTIRLGTATCRGDQDRWIESRPTACFVVTNPHTIEDASYLGTSALMDHKYVEVLFADNAPDAITWTLRTIAGPQVACDIPAPPAAWIDQWLTTTPPIAGKTPADWFIDATEALGDAVLTQTDGTLQSLEKCLEAVTNHEVLHQRLGAAARALAMRS